MNLKIYSDVAGFFKLEATDVRTGERRVLADWFPNLITNGGLNQIGSTANWLTGCSVGSGTTAPADTDTELTALIATSTDIVGTTSSVLDVSPFYGSVINTYFFPAGAATGTLAELGVGLSPTALFSHALILDSGGSPTTVTVTNNESLTVFYEFRHLPPLTDVMGSLDISGITYDYTVRAANVGAGNWAPSKLGDIGGPVLVTAFEGDIAAITSAPSGTSAVEDSGADPGYTTGSFANNRSSVFGAASANFGGINSILVICGQTNTAMGQFQVGFSPAIPKDDTQSLTLTVQQSWARGT
jgi:hypothetical protein